MVKPYQRITSLVCLACETDECDKCNIDDLAQRIVSDVRKDAIEELGNILCNELDAGYIFMEKHQIWHFVDQLKEKKNEYL